MKAKVKISELKAALNKFATLPGRDNGLPGNSIMTIEADEFGGLRLARSTIQAFARITCEGEIEAPGKAALPYRPFCRAVDSCAGDVLTLALAGKELCLLSKEGDEAAVSLWPENEVIPAPPPLKGIEITLRHEELFTTLKVAGAAASNDRAREHLMGVTFRKVPGALSVFGCNGHRAHVCRIAALVDRIDPEPETERDFGVLLPTEGVDCAKTMFKDEKKDCFLTIGVQGIQMDAGEISVRLPAGNTRAPFMEPLLSPEPEIQLTVERKALLEAVKAAAPTASEGDESICLTLEDRLIKVAARNSGARVSRSVPCQANGSGQYFVLARYLIQLLEAAELDTLHLWVAHRGQQLFYREGERDFLIMFRQAGTVTPLTKQKK